MLKRICVLLISLLLLALQGCVAVQSFPTAARSGDTITLAVGSPDGMTKANTTAQFVSDDPAYPTPVDLTIRSIIRLRPDNTSSIATFDIAFTSSITYYSSHSLWLSVIVIDLPPGLPVGTGKIQINTEGTYGIGDNINDYPVKVEILPGTGVTNSFDYYNGSASGYFLSGNLQKLEPLPQVVVHPPKISHGWYGAPNYGAAEIKINVPTQKAGGGEISTNDIKIVQDDMYITNNTTQCQMSWSRIGNDIIVRFISPTGTMKFYQPRFSVVVRPGNEFIQSPGPSITSLTYYDVNGNVVTDSTPTASDFSIDLE